MAQEWGALVWEIRTVNHRYLEPHFRLPDSMREIEPHLRNLLRKELSRGKVECTLKVIRNEGSEQLAINQNILEQLNQVLATVQASIPHAQKANALDILRWPGVLEQTGADISQIHTDAVASFTQALTQIQETRTREGTELKQFILQRLTAIGQETAVVRQFMPELLQAQRDKILQRLNEMQVDIDHNRLEQELVFIAQKADVEEELDRLETHLNEVSRTLNSNGAVGRRLDFLMQELNREANTLGSKALGVEVSQSAINLKVLIEQMREQICNIE